MQQFKIQSILSAAEAGSGNILANNQAATIRRSGSGEIAKLYSLNSITSPLLPNPFLTDQYGQFAFFAQDGKYKVFNAENVEIAEFILQDPFMTMVERDGAPLTVTGQNHNNHFMIDSENPMTVTVGRPVMDSPIDYQTGILIYFTQIGDGPVILEPLPAGGGFPAVELIWPENSSPQTYGKGATIGIESRNETQWIVTGHLGI
jgi:hypothetical protein